MIKKNKLLAFENVNAVLNPADWMVQRSNPNYWDIDGVRGSFTHVFAPSFPEIEKAYSEAGINVFRNNAEESIEAVMEKVVEDVKAIEEVEETSIEEQDSTTPFTTSSKESSADWRDMPWMEMRSFLISKSEDVPKNINKADAIKMLEELEANGGL